MSIHLKEYTPAAPLTPFIEYYWEGIYCGSALNSLEQKVIPTGYIDFILHLSDARCEVKMNSDWQISAPFFLSGFWSTPIRVQFWERVETFNIRFKPEAIEFLFGIPAAEFQNTSGNLEDVLGPSFSSFCFQLEASRTVNERIKLTDEYLLNKLYNSKIRFSYLQVASDLIRNQKCEISVEALSDKVCISARQLEREFKNKLGISPKT